ncbi:MAG: hypothetical protein M0Q49_03555 [Porticoccaceae bacterium]|nr:hypothetical protein [Porticoccaceae bacterium]
MTTPILGIPELADGQIDQFATANEAFRALEAAGNDFRAADLSSGNVTLTAAQFAGDVLIRCSGNTVARTLTVPAAKRLFAVHNGGSWPLTVARGSTSISVPAGEARLLYADGTASGLMSVAGGGGGDALGIVTESTTSRTLSLNDAGKYLRCTSSSATTVEVPPNSAVAFAIGTQIHIRDAGLGGVTIAQGSGVTVNPPAGGTLVLAGEGATATLVKIATNSWDLMGQVVAL